MSKKQHIQEKIIGIQDTRKLEIKSEVDVLQALFLQLSETNTDNCNGLYTTHCSCPYQKHEDKQMKLSH